MKWTGSYKSNQKGLLYYVGLCTLPKGIIELDIDEDVDSFISTASIIQNEGKVERGTVTRESGSRKLYLAFGDYKLIFWVSRWTSEEMSGCYSSDSPFYDQGSFKLNLFSNDIV